MYIILCENQIYNIMTIIVKTLKTKTKMINRGESKGAVRPWPP